MYCVIALGIFAVFLIFDSYITYLREKLRFKDRDKDKKND